MAREEFIREINKFFESKESLRDFFFENSHFFDENFYQNLRGADYTAIVNSLILELERRKETRRVFILAVRNKYPDFYKNFGKDNTQENPTTIPKVNQQKDRILDLLEENYLKNLPSGKGLIELEIKKKSNSKNFTEDTSTYKIQNLLDENKQILLIIGEAFVGKTTTLFQLAKIRWENAKQSLNTSLPIGLDLSRWKDGLYFEQWLIPELHRIYEIQPNSSEELLKQHKIILFLDGLERLNIESRLKCLQSINSFVLHYKDNIKLVVSCTTKQYEEMSEGLIIERTTCFEVQPLKETQINHYLNSQKDDPKFQILKELLQNHQILRNAVRTPLVLKIMPQIDNIEHIIQENDKEKRRKLFIEAYVDKQFEYVEEQYEKLEYNRENIKNWLSWLAKHMGDQAIFFIEEMQPEENDWLDETQIKTFRRLAISWHGLFMGLLLGPIYGSILHCYLSHLQQSTKSSLQQGIIIGIIQGIISGPIISSVQKKEKLKIETYNSLTQKFSIREYTKKILENMRSPKTIYLVMVVVSIVAILCIIVMPFIGYQWSDALLTAIICGPFFGVVTFISKSIETSSIKPEDYYQKVKKPKPNQAIQELRNIALSIMAISSVSIYICYIFIIIVFGKTDIIMLILGLITAVTTGLVASLIHPNTTSYRLHYILRLVLVIHDNTPLNYIKFLDYVVEKPAFMKRISGGYQFSNQLYEDYFKNK